MAAAKEEEKVGVQLLPEEEEEGSLPVAEVELEVLGEAELRILEEVVEAIQVVPVAAMLHRR